MPSAVGAVARLCIFLSMAYFRCRSGEIVTLSKPDGRRADGRDRGQAPALCTVPFVVSDLGVISAARYATR